MKQLRPLLFCAIALVAAACALPDHGEPSPTVADDLAKAIRAAGLVPDSNLEVTISPGAGRVQNSLLVPYQSVTATSSAKQDLVASQVMVFLRFEDGEWTKVGCTADARLESDPSGCDLEGGAQIVIPPGASVTDGDSLQFVLDWPLAIPPRSGTYAVVIAFGNSTPYELGAGDLLQISSN